jgi:hypothetical protein
MGISGADEGTPAQSRRLPGGTEPRHLQDREQPSSFGFGRVTAKQAQSQLDKLASCIAAWACAQTGLQATILQKSLTQNSPF